jgi:hypothetical protein
MRLNKRQSWLAFLAVWFFLCLLYQSVWIFSGTAKGEIIAVSSSHRTGYSWRGSRLPSWMRASYEVGGVIYTDTYLKDDDVVRDHYFTVRYLVFYPGISRPNTFTSNWGPLIILFIILSLITSIVYIRKDIVSDQAIIIVQAKRPFISVTNNLIEDYDSHDIEDKSPAEAGQALTIRLQTEADSIQMTAINTSVYKYNPNAIGIFVVYVFFFFWFFYSLLSGQLGNFGILFFGAVLIFVPLYIQNTSNPTFKAKIPDEGCLIFSPEGVQYNDDFYTVGHIEATVVYLESFRGFTYRNRITTGRVNTVSSGDNNKIVFRYEKEVMDFTFILDYPTDYWSFKNLMSKWSATGINVVLEKVFEDDFMIQEMVHFQTPVGGERAIPEESERC